MREDISETNEEKPFFQLFFLKYDKDQVIVEAEGPAETIEEIDFREVKNRLKQGETILITSRQKQGSNTDLADRKDPTKSNFLEISESYQEVEIITYCEKPCWKT